MSGPNSINPTGSINSVSTAGAADGQTPATNKKSVFGKLRSNLMSGLPFAGKAKPKVYVPDEIVALEPRNLRELTPEAKAKFTPKMLKNLKSLEKFDKKHPGTLEKFSPKTLEGTTTAKVKAFKKLPNEVRENFSPEVLQKFNPRQLKELANYPPDALNKLLPEMGRFTPKEFLNKFTPNVLDSLTSTNLQALAELDYDQLPNLEGMTDEAVTDWIAANVAKTIDERSINTALNELKELVRSHAFLDCEDIESKPESQHTKSDTEQLELRDSLENFLSRLDQYQDGSKHGWDLSPKIMEGVKHLTDSLSCYEGDEAPTISRVEVSILSNVVKELNQKLSDDSLLVNDSGVDVEGYDIDLELLNIGETELRSNRPQKIGLKSESARAPAENEDDNVTEFTPERPKGMAFTEAQVQKIMQAEAEAEAEEAARNSNE